MNKNIAPDFIIVDASSYLYRAFHAMPDLRAQPLDPHSEPTGAIRGMINMLNSLQKSYPCTKGVCVFDASGPTFRHELYADYKANRSSMPEDLRRQIEPIHELIALLGWPLLCVANVEADDVIGTLAHQADQQGYQVLISSGDKDLCQLITDKISIVDTMNGKLRNKDSVFTEFGVYPEQMVDFQTLMGDSIDNVPGVEKVGPKTAAKWLQTYGNLDRIIAHSHEIKGVVAEHLKKAIDWLPTGKRLVTILTDLDLSAYCPQWPSIDGFLIQAPQQPALHDFYAKKGFQSLLHKKTKGADQPPQQGSLLAMEFAEQEPIGGSIETIEAPPREYEIILNEAQFTHWLTLLKTSQEIVAIDTETTSLDPMQARLVGLSVAISPSKAAYIPLQHDYLEAPRQLPMQYVLESLKPWLENPQALKVGQHTKYDQHVWANHGIAIDGVVHDTLLQSYVLEAHQSHHLEGLALRHLGKKGISYEELCGKKPHQLPIHQVDVERVGVYACEDADLCLQVHLKLWAHLQTQPALLAIYQLEMQASQVLFKMERQGVLIEASLLQKQSQSLGEKIQALEKQAYALAGQTFNLASPKQIGEIFFQQLQLPVIKKTSTGAPSTDEEVLEKLAQDYPLPQTLLEYRSLSKLKNTYTDKLAALIQPQTGRVHTHYAQAVAVTGRLSSNEPNLQNIPIRRAEGRQIREAFIAPDRYAIASADYSQIELRIMAHLSEDPHLLEAFQQGKDVHRATAADIFGVSLQEVNADQRRTAKVINFGLIYGMSPFGLAKNLGIDHSSAKLYMERYFARYQGVLAYMERTRALAKQQAYVETVWGRRLFLPEIRSPNGPRRAAAERAAINAPMQGTAADLIKKAMIEVQKAIEKEGLQSKLIMQVHDELVLEVHPDEKEWVMSQVPFIMAHVAELKVPLIAEIGIGANWEQAH